MFFFSFPQILTKIKLEKDFKLYGVKKPYNFDNEKEKS